MSKGKDGVAGKIVFRYVESTILTHRKADEVLEILEKLRNERKI